MLLGMLRKFLARYTNESDHAESNFDQGQELHELRRFEEALASYDRAIALNADYTEAYSRRGVVLRDLGRLDDALASCDRAIALKPDYANAHVNRGVVLYGMHRLDEALTSYDNAIATKPDYVIAHINRGVVLQDRNRTDDALQSYDRAIALTPDNPVAHLNRGVVLQDLNRLDEALTSYDRAIALKPELPQPYWNKSMLKLSMADYLEGWELFEWRWKLAPDALNKFTKPFWSGAQSLAGKTLLIHSDQGLGDSIQSCRYASMAKSLDAEVILTVQRPLIPLLSTLKGNFSIVDQNAPLPDHDFHCPIMSLPYAFRTTVQTIPASIPYLFVDEQKQKLWHNRLGDKDKTKPRIGLVWSGGTAHRNDKNRSISLETFRSILQLPIEFHSLQKEVRPKDLEELKKYKQVQQHQDSLMDFADTAALIGEMDLIISVDTSDAHLAGALGQKIWILLPFAADYRWMLDRSDSPWYPTAKLFRQREIGDWPSVILEVENQLHEMITSA